MAPAPTPPTPFSDPLRFDGAVRTTVLDRPLIILRRFATRLITHVIPMMLVVITGTFFLIHLAPGSFVEIMSSEMQISDQAMIDRLTATYGLDRPLWEQWLRYLGAVAHFDLGFSYRQNIPVIDAILHHLPATLLLMTSALGVALVVGVSAGALAASRANSFIDRALTLTGVFLFAAPGFWLGIMLIVLFGVTLRWLPIGDMQTVGASYGPVDQVIDVGRHLLLPALALGLHQSAIYLRVTRIAMLEAGAAEYVKTARAKGLSSGAVSRRHIFRNALLPVITVLGVQFANFLSVSVIVEAVFNWPGIGSLIYDAVVARDYPMVLGIVILSSLMVIAVNQLIDIAYAWLDPRVVLD